ncbi:chorismate-binding protein [Allomuricauda sp. d1]|uniref:chorismate-binding protein n=1 Tax=Allomuricauda sp. d1 TaxID=3136725 RepID=UPI0031D20A3B
MPYQRTDSFHTLLAKAKGHFKDRLPFVLYRKPFKNTVTAIFQKTDRLFHVDNFTESGFIFVPFDWQGEKVLLWPDEINTAVLYQDFKVASKEVVLSSEGKATYEALFQKAKHQIERGELRKVVLSRRVEVPIVKNGLELFGKMLAKYQNAFCYVWYHPKIGQWMGATPEVLLEANGDNIETVSLAGTQKVTSTSQPTWTEKELEEQRLVTDFIKNCYSENLESVSVSKAESIRAGTLWHLKSRISGVKSTEFSMDDLLRQLHPTPAVCGLPKATAFEFLQKHEGYGRQYYTGFLGELNLTSDDNAHLFVNLRCLQIKNKKAMIYVGGGITSKSEAAQEWTETQNKSLTMLELL